MLTKIFKISAFIIIGFLFVMPSNISSYSCSAATSFRTVTNNAYTYGERLDYKVVYSFITAGYGYFQIMPKSVIKNKRKCYDVRFQVESLKSLEWLYKVKDAFRTYLDVEGIFPWEFEQHNREGNYKKDYKAYFDQVNHFAIVDNKRYNVGSYIHDIVSAFFYVRTMNLGDMPKGKVFYLQNFFDDKSYKLGVKILGKETVEVDAGTFRCIMLEPLVVEGGLFKSEGSIYLWVTDDENKMPVKVATKIPIGYVNAELIKYSNLKNSVDAKIE